MFCEDDRWPGWFATGVSQTDLEGINVSGTLQLWLVWLAFTSSRDRWNISTAHILAGIGDVESVKQHCCFFFFFSLLLLFRTDTTFSIANTLAYSTILVSVLIAHYKSKDCFLRTRRAGVYKGIEIRRFK